MKFLVKFHFTFPILKFRFGNLGHIIFSFFFFSWKWKVPVKHVFGHYGDFYPGHFLCFRNAIFQFFDFFYPYFFFRGTFFLICFTNWKFGFTGRDFVFFSQHFWGLMGSFFLVFHWHEFGLHKWNSAKIFTGIFSFSRALFEGFSYKFGTAKVRKKVFSGLLEFVKLCEILWNFVKYCEILSSKFHKISCHLKIREISLL